MKTLSKFKIADSYGSAWYKVAKEQSCEDKTLDDAKFLLFWLSANSNVWNKLSSPLAPTTVVLDLTSQIAKELKLSKITAQTLNVLIENKRFSLLDMVCKSFIDYYQKDKNIIEVKVETVVALTKEQDKKLKKILEDKLESHILLDYTINPNILGGLRISYQSVIIDNSLLNKLNKMEKLLME